MIDPVKILIGTALYQCRYYWKDSPDTFLTFPEQKFLESRARILGESLLSSKERKRIKALPYQERNRIRDELSFRGASQLNGELKELFEEYRYNKRRRQWFTSVIAYVLMAVKFGYFDAKQSIRFRQSALRLENKIARQSFNANRDIDRADILIDDVLTALFPDIQNGGGMSRANALAEHLQLNGNRTHDLISAPLLRT